MEFEELQKIWNQQKGETMYAINEQAMHQTIKNKKSAASQRINKVEISLILINSFCAVFLFIDALNDTQKWDFAGSAVFAFTVGYLIHSRVKRKKAEQVFDRTMIGELDHAIANTQSIIKVTYLMIFGYLIPLATLYITKMIVTDTPFQNGLIIAGMFLLAFILIFWERKKMHIPRINKLKKLRKELLK
jgi:hypothetical protein